MQRLLDLLTGRGEEPGLDRAALELARIEYPSLDIEPYISMLDSYAVELAERLAGRTGGQTYVETANRYLFEELGFAGNTADYYDPRNSCLNEVLTGRTGIPITLAVVYLEIGRRLAQPVYGIGLPGHFVVQYRDADFAVFIDVFHGGRLLTAEGCFELARSHDPRILAPAGNRQILTRMLHNLRGVYVDRGAYGKALQTLNLLMAADPHAVELYKERAMLHVRMRNPPAARGDLETYLRLAPEAPDRAEIETQMRTLRAYQARLN